MRRARVKKSSKKSGSRFRAYKSKSKQGRSNALFKRRISTEVRNLNNMIETKTTQWKTGTTGLPPVPPQLPHNQVYIILDDAGNQLNIFKTVQSVNAAETGIGGRIGDKLSVKGVTIKAFIENALARSRVNYRLMLLKMAKGQTLDRSTLFLGDSNNKMLDVVDTRRFTIVWQKTFTITALGAQAAYAVTAAGVPQEHNIAGDVAGGVGSKIIKAWIPGRRFGKGGVIQYEVGSQTQVKWFDYRLVIVAYDWFGTPQDANNVGVINELMTKVYYKDA